MGELTVRMRRCGPDRTLNGYVFTDMAHARQWLSQEFVKGDVDLDEVEIGPIVRCRSCNGSGFRQDQKMRGRLTLEEVLHPATPPPGDPK